MELRYHETRPGDVVIPPREWSEIDVALLVRREGDEISLILDDLHTGSIVLHESEIDSLIEALKIMKENKNV